MLTDDRARRKGGAEALGTVGPAVDSDPPLVRGRVSGLHTTLRSRVTHFGVLVAHPMAFLVVGAYGVLWFLFERDTFNWHAVATLAIWFMTLFIQRVGHRDTQALQAKLDELLHVQGAARNELTRIDEQEPEDIARHRAEARKND